MHLTVLLRRAALLLAAALAACSAVPNPVLRTLQQAVQGGGVANPRLDPHFRYLWVAVDGAASFLILGNEEAAPGGPVEVWYSADGEVLRLQRGRGGPGRTMNVPVSGRDDPAWPRAMSICQSRA